MMRSFSRPLPAIGPIRGEAQSPPDEAGDKFDQALANPAPSA